MDFREALLQEMQKSKNKLIENKKIVKESKIEEDTEEYLEPRFDSRASFYKKAKVVKKDNGDEELYSYDTLVGGVRDGKPYSKGKFSQTTSRHQREYFTQKGFDPKKVDVVENCGKKEAGKKLTEDSYEEPIFQSVEEALREYGFDVTRFNDAGVLTKNLGWIIENEAGELEITCDGTYLDESKKLTERKNGVEGIKDIVNNRIAPDLDLVIELADEIKDQNPKYEGFVNVAEDCKSNIVHGLAEITDYLNESCGRNCGTKKKVTEETEDMLDAAYNYLDDIGLSAADLLMKVSSFFGQDEANEFAHKLLSEKDESKKVTEARRNPFTKVGDTNMRGYGRNTLKYPDEILALSFVVKTMVQNAFNNVSAQEDTEDENFDLDNAVKITCSKLNNNINKELNRRKIPFTLKFIEDIYDNDSYDFIIDDIEYTGNNPETIEFMKSHSEDEIVDAIYDIYESVDDDGDELRNNNIFHDSANYYAKDINELQDKLNKLQDRLKITKNYSKAKNIQNEIDKVQSDIARLKKYKDSDMNIIKSRMSKNK